MKHLNSVSIKPAAAQFPIFAAHCAPGGNLMFNAGFSQGEAVGSYRGDPLRT
jgi:hypothetical protein